MYWYPLYTLYLQMNEKMREKKKNKYTIMQWRLGLGWAMENFQSVTQYVEEDVVICCGQYIRGRAVML